MSYDNIPRELRELKSWVNFGKKDCPEKEYKKPYTPGTYYGARANDPKTWRTFNEALAEVKAGHFAGVGFELTGSGIVAIDFDGCITGGVLNEIVAKWIERFDSYTEISPSGKGIHILCRGKLPGTSRKTKAGEMYDTGRYMTMTGNVYGEVKPLRDAQGDIDALYALLSDKRDTPTQAPVDRAPVALDDAELINKAIQSSAKFAALWNGDISGYPSHSEADQALCNLLAFWTNGDERRIDSLFRCSGLMREKWDKPTAGSTYGANTIKEAIRTMTSGYDPGERTQIKTAPQKVADSGDIWQLFKTLDKFKEEEATWLVPSWIPEGYITLLAADGGVGKTTMWCHIIAALSSGTTCILDPPEYTREQKKIVFITTEDSVRKKLRKKLREAGANMKNIITPDFAADTNNLLRDLKFGTELMSQMIEHFSANLYIFDPVQGFVPPGINMGSRNAMRDCMAPLIPIGEKTGAAYIVVCHSNKRKGAYGRDRIADSADLWDIARSVIMAGYTETQDIRYLSNEKNNYSAYPETVLFSIDNGGQIVKEGTTWKHDREYVLNAAISTTKPKREDCKEYILNTLREAGGEMSTNDLDKKANTAGYSFKTLRNAKSELKEENKIGTFSTGYGKSKKWHTQLIQNPDFEELPETITTPFEGG
jgi:predicted ATP-dependent serine protease